MLMLQKLKRSVKACAAIDSLNASKLKTGQTSVGGHKGGTKTSILGLWPPKKGNSPNIATPRSSSEKKELTNGRTASIEATVIGVDEPRKHVDPLPPLPETSVLERQNTHLLPRPRSLEAVKTSDILTKHPSKDHIIVMPPFDNDASIRVPFFPIDNEGAPFSPNENQDGVHAALYAISPNISPLSNTNKKKSQLENRKYAETLGRQLFNQICPRNQREISIQNFKRFFQSDEQVLEAFRLFDRDENGTVSREEFIFSLQLIYKEKKDISLSVNDLTQALGNLNKILTVFSAILCAMLSFPLFEISLNVLLPFTSVLLAMSFVFGGYARVTFECIIFLFVIHPYDTGDRIFFDDGSNFIVEELNILTTTLGIDGRKFYVPNRNLKLILEVMATRTIMNTRRSGDMPAFIELKVPIYTPEETMRKLQKKMLEFVTNNPKLYFPDCTLNIAEVGFTNMMEYKFNIPYKGNWQVI
jgi:hypothetical protein